MRYDLSKIPVGSLLRPVSDASSAFARLDERVARSVIGDGWIARSHFVDACASLWIDGELVDLEDLVLHDAGHDVRAPTHELTIARDVLRTRRRIAGQPTGWALSPEGWLGLRKGDDGGSKGTTAEDPSRQRAPETKSAAAEPDHGLTELSERLDAELASIDAILARSEAALAEVRSASVPSSLQRDALIYDADWDEEARLEEWRNLLLEIEGLPPILQTAIALDAWNILAALEHTPWLGRLLAASILHRAGMTTGHHLAAINLGLRSILVDRRRHRDRDVRIGAIVQGLVTAAELGTKEHGRLLLARQMMEKKLVGRRTSSRMPMLIDLVLASPLVSVGMAADALDITPQAALRVIGELGLREVTGRGRFRAWGLL